MSDRMTDSLISVVVPALNERDALGPLIDEIAEALEPSGRDFEVIVIDDGSTDGTIDLIAELSEARPWLRGLRLRRNSGKSAALATGFEASRGDVIVTIDG